MLDSQSSSQPPRYVEPVHVFEASTKRRRAIAIFLAVASAFGLALFAGDFVLRLDALPSLADRAAPLSGVSDSEAARTGHDWPDQSVILNAPRQTNCTAPATKASRRFAAAYMSVNDSLASEAGAARCDSSVLGPANSYARGDPEGSVVPLGRGDQRPAVTGNKPVLFTPEILSSDPDAAARVFARRDSLVGLSAELAGLIAATQRQGPSEALHSRTATPGSLAFAPDPDSTKTSYVELVLDGNALRPCDGAFTWTSGCEERGNWDLTDAAPGRSGSVDILKASFDPANMLRTEGRRAFADDFAVTVAALTAVEANPASGGFVDQSYRAIPFAKRIKPTAQTKKAELSLTFDGLPAQAELAELLALLKQHGVEATFFVDGPAMLARGDGLRRLTANGHIIGMLYSEPEASLTSMIFGPKLVDNATQQMIARETGKRTLLVRARPGRDSLSESNESLAAFAAQRASGYLPLVAGLAATFGAIDQQDIVARQASSADAEAGNVLRFDLSSGNGSNVISALPSILSELEAKGVRFLPLRLAFDLTADEAMPVSSTVSPGRDAVAFGVLRFMQSGMTTVFLWMMAIAALRSLTFLALALGRGRRTAFDPEFQPAVTVIVPAFNEEGVIERCIASLLKQDYPNIEIVVVDDGSTDRTLQLVREEFGNHPRVTLIDQENRGKWCASNYALSVVTTPFFVIADADSLFLPDTVSWLVQQFKDESVGAVAGLVEVGNHENLLSDCQRIEYIVSQNVLRRAYETFEGILVVPGAVGAWRTEAVFRAHEFSGDTITEDADLTVAVHRAGYRIRFQEQARSVTEAPATVRSFLRQRLRWTFGMLQVAWKHRGAIGEGRAVGLISIVDSILFGLVSSVVSPLVDVLLLLLVIQGGIIIATWAEIGLAGGFPMFVLLSFLVLTVIDIMNILAAFWYERRFNLKLLLLVPFLRFGYRQLLYYSTLRAIWQAVSGRMAGWNKLERTGAIFADSDRGSQAGKRMVPNPVDELETA